MNKPELETLNYKPTKPSPATEGKNTCIIELGIGGENSKVVGQPLEQPKSKEWLCGGTKIIKATKEEREYYAELDIACPGCPDCKPEQPNTELLIVKTIQGLLSAVNKELEKLVELQKAFK